MPKNENIVVPSWLSPGDTVGLVAPSRKVSPAEVEQITVLLKSWGYNVVQGNNLFAEENQFAGADALRASDINTMFVNADIKAIWAVRGGYGCARLMGYLNTHAIRSNPKWFIGYSDLTVMHSFLHTLGVASLHATMPINFSPENTESQTWKLLQQTLGGTTASCTLPSNLINREGEAEGILVGGNLSVLYSLRGTPWDIDMDGKILFIEDIDEYLYHIDRMMINLQLGGKLKNLAGLVIGGMTDMKDNAVPFGRTAYQIVADAVKDYSFPVLFDFPAGHCEPNLPLVFGAKARLTVSAKGGLLRYV